MRPEKSGSKVDRSVEKIATGIQGLDEITLGGLPAGRPTLLCGGAGTGKTLFAMEFIIKGISQYNENGAFLSFEESRAELSENVVSLGYDIGALETAKKIYIREMDLLLQDGIEVGDYDLSGLFAQIGHAIDSVGAKRVVIDGIETLFSFFSRDSIIRRELRRLFRWLKDKKVTAIITTEQGNSSLRLTRHGIEEYLSDCVIFLDNRIENQISTRRLRILKYRGSRHGTNEYPFIVTDSGIAVFPITSLSLEYDITSERISTGIKKLDELFGGFGYFKGANILITGTAGTGKSSLAAYFANAICKDGGKCLYFAFEESEKQIVRNMDSIGLKIQSFVDNGLLKFYAVRPVLQGLEMHLLTMLNIIQKESPQAVVLDPISNLDSVGTSMDIKLMFLRIIDFMKIRGITALFTNLKSEGDQSRNTEEGVSSIMDTWILLKNEPSGRKTERSLLIIKSRGMGHSNQVHPFKLTDDGIYIS